MASYLYAVQDEGGTEIVSAHVDVQKVSDVHAEVTFASVKLMFEDIVIESASYEGDGKLKLCRWPSNDKLGRAVEHPVR